MLRRVAQVLRLLLTGAGLASLLLLLLSLVVYVQYMKTWGWTHYFSTRLEAGNLQFEWYMGGFTTDAAGFRWGRNVPFFGPWEDPWPVFEAWNANFVDPETANNIFVSIPLWLLAFLCLAWPVTSFIITRRRRRGRGFPVVTAGTLNIQHRTSNIEVPEGASPEPQRGAPSQSPGQRPG